MLRNRLQAFVGEISDDHAIFKDGELEAQVQVKVTQIEEKVGELTNLLSSSMGRSDLQSVKVKGELASEEWAELGVEDAILKSEAMSSLSESLHRLKDPKLKMCLVCLSIFTDNTPIKKRPLIYWWMGEGFVPTEEAGEQMFQEILNLEGFTNQATANSLTVYPWTRRMLLKHAQEAGVLEYTSYPQLAACDSDKCAFLRPFASDGGGENLVTVFNVNEQYLGGSLEWASTAQKVEVLQLGRWQDSVTHHIEAENSRKLLKGMGSQKQLKYLSLRGVARIETLPDSIGQLVSLRILDLRACHNLEKLPESISNLRKLTHLDVSECYLVESMPKGLHSLSNLQVLKGFVCSKNSCRVAELEGLKHLRKLSIRLGSRMGKDKEKDKDKEDLTCLARFPALRILTISWGSLSEKDRALISFDKAVSLPTDLTKLELRYVPFITLPQWVYAANLPANLKKLYFKGGYLKSITVQEEYYMSDPNSNLCLRVRYFPT